jgi:hypothetical protein
LINESQFGFTPQRSTEHALHLLKDFINDTFDKKGFALIVSLDISGAFNYCWWTKVLYQLRIKRCPENINKVIESYFSARKAKLWYLNREVEREITIGCPQGSASSPWFWNICFDDIFDLSEENIKINCFADDTILMFYAQNTNELQLKVNNKLRQIHEWGKANKLSFLASWCYWLSNDGRFRFDNGI